jgi:hypothetical protein
MCTHALSELKFLQKVGFKPFESRKVETRVLVQQFQNICKYSLKLGHTDTITLKKDVISMVLN